MSSSNMTYAQALNDAKMLIVQQSNRIKSDAEKLRGQAQEISRLKASAAEMTRELERFKGLEARLAEVTEGREHAEATAGRQRVQIDSLEASSKELQRVLGEQGETIAELTGELNSLRDQMPSEDDASALAAMAALLQTTKGGAKPQPQPEPKAPGQPKAAPRRRQDDGGVEHPLRAPFTAGEIIIPAEPTPLRLVAARQAADEQEAAAAEAERAAA